MESYVVLQELLRCMFQSSLPQFMFNDFYLSLQPSCELSYFVCSISVLRYTIGADSDGMNIKVLEK